MGNYFFSADALREALGRDHADPGSQHDFGKNVIPALMQDYPVYVYNFLENRVPGEEEHARGYWRDVGTVEAYYDASMDLRAAEPLLNLYNYEWPIRSTALHYPPAKFVFNEGSRRGTAVDSIIANGTIVSGASVNRSIVFSNVFVHSYSDIQDSILLQGCNIGRGARLRRVICDQYVTIEDEAVIGEDPVADAERFHVTPTGIIVVPKGTIVPRRGAVMQSTNLPPSGSIRPRAHEPGAVVITSETLAK
jgi:glucose-1-phosphate adenylyltransferase